LKAKAIEHYEKFLSLWKDADPGIAEVEEARESQFKNLLGSTNIGYRGRAIKCERMHVTDFWEVLLLYLSPET
jgi:hypothetical protein